jgi:high-affinity iron transporter
VRLERLDRPRQRRGLPILAGLLGVLIVLGLWAGTASAAPSQSANSRDDAIRELENTRLTIDETLRLLDAGKREEAFAASKAGYLDHFETVEIPLRVADPGLTLKAEETFAEIRALTKTNASTTEIRDKIVELRGIVNDAERKLTEKGLSAPMLAFSQAFTVLFREGLEAVLLLSVLLGYLESTKNSQYKKPILYGVAAAGIATIATFFAMDAIFSVLPFRREVLEAIVALLAVVVLFYVSFWLISRLEHRRWLEFLKARVWTAVSAGSVLSLALIGFTSVYREGFETALFFQALTTFGDGLGVWVAAGAITGAIALGIIAFLIFRYGRKLPIRQFLSVAVVLVMATSVAFLGNAVVSLQEAAILDFHRLDGWPRLPIFLAQMTGYHPTVEVVVAQGSLAAIYLLGALYMFVIRPRRQRTGRVAPGPNGPAGGDADDRAVNAPPVAVPSS